VKVLKNKEIGQDVNPLPEIEIPGFCGRLVHRIVHIRPHYWLVATAVVLAVFLTFVPQTIWAALLKSLEAQKFLVIMLAVFSLTAISLVWATGQRIDVWFFTFINERGHRPPWLDWMMLCFTQLGNGVFAYTVAFILFLRVKHLLGYELIFGNLTLWLMVELMKVLIRRGRPFSKPIGTRVVGDRAGGHSFPSGHTSQAFFMASLMSHYFHAGVWITILLYAAALFVGITRMYVGMHYPRDVLGGAILGTAWGLLGVIINSYIFAELISLHLIGT
jgi:membrane-associated phospholipid phosphatase